MQSITTRKKLKILNNMVRLYRHYASIDIVTDTDPDCMTPGQEADMIAWAVRKIERLMKMNQLLADHLRQTTKRLQELEERE